MPNFEKLSVVLKVNGYHSAKCSRKFRTGTLIQPNYQSRNIQSVFSSSFGNLCNKIKIQRIKMLQNFQKSPIKFNGLTRKIQTPKMK